MMVVEYVLLIALFGANRYACYINYVTQKTDAWLSEENVFGF